MALYSPVGFHRTKSSPGQSLFTSRTTAYRHAPLQVKHYRRQWSASWSLLGVTRPVSCSHTSRMRSSLLPSLQHSGSDMIVTRFVLIRATTQQISIDPCVIGIGHGSQPQLGRSSSCTGRHVSGFAQFEFTPKPV